MIRSLLTNPEHREKIAFLAGDTALSYGDLLSMAQALQEGLPPGPGDVVALLLPNGSEYLAALWGVLEMGNTAFPINPLMTGPEILPLLRQSRARGLITTQEILDQLEKVPGFGGLSLKILLTEGLRPGTPRPLTAWPKVAADSPMLLLQTSGTTGKAKLVQLSEGNVRAAVLGYLGKLRFPQEEARYTLAVPFSSVYGMMILSACLLRAYPLVLLEPPFTLDALYQAAEQHGITHYEGSASTILLMEQMAGRAISYNIASLRYFGFGGSKVSGNVLERLHRAYPGRAFYQGYGMTEAAPLITKHGEGALEKMDSVGTAIQGLEIAIQDGDQISRQPYVQGEILIKGPNVMLGYLEDPVETARILEGGYLHTGDVGFLDEEGHLYLCGRKKAMIIIRGYKVHPEEVEACILNSGLARDCLVYGQCHPSGEETLCADIVPRDGQVRAEEIQLHCRDHLAPYKHPRMIRFRESIPKNSAGKILRPENGSWS